jgi:hypothetical protein
MPSQFNREKTQKTIRQLLNNMKTEADPHLLNEYRSLFKKEVSLFRRSWAAAYLLMLRDQGEPGPADRFEKNRSRTSGKAGRNQDRQDRAPERPERKPRSGEGGQRGPYPLADEDSRRLFFSIGRNRRVFSREILGIINAKTAIPKEDIGAIRILDNYSFVQVRDTVADRIIEALNGQPFRGKVLTVSYARARNEEGGEPAASEERDDGGFTDDGPGQETDNHAAHDGPDTNDGAPAHDGGFTDNDPGEETDDRAHDVYYGIFLDSFRSAKSSPADPGAKGNDAGEGPGKPDEPEGLSEQEEDHPDKEGI